jgi:hypothetical protein
MEQLLGKKREMGERPFRAQHLTDPSGIGGVRTRRRIGLAISPERTCTTRGATRERPLCF